MRFISPNTPFFDNVSGAPVALGTAYFGVANTDPKTNPKVPYADSAFTTPLPAELALDVAGKIQDEVWLNGTYSLVVEDADGVQVFNEPYITPPAGGGGGGGGTVDSVVAGSGITVDSSDPANPVVSAIDSFSTDNTDTSYTLAATNDHQWMDITGSGTVDITCPPESDDDLGPLFVHIISNYNTGTVTIVAGSGVTVRPPPGGTLVIPQYATVGIKKADFASDTYIVFGPTTAST